ncbi:LA2681 family HEPN domain-containing protein [Microbacterium sp. BE35]|uniref:LA2681 family HEPN domain-containing protein n=1 Tax=Microbacterium sp. BE35 TaxID=2817773 RepID=UPI00286B8F5A|nr:LA2681 family HEPN domain-containing protein [Microbacterium sp. BE35]
MKFSCSSLLINLGALRANQDAVAAGIQCARDALDRGLVHELDGQLKYNVANGLSALHHLDLAEWRGNEPTQPRGVFGLRDRDRLRATRTLFAAAGHSDEPADVRGRALCNLGNTLDHSGRWLEAYQAYVDALAADPTNGNAAGNAAELLRVRAARKRGLSGHYAAVYDRYREQARRHRARTVELAGEEVARRWDALPPSGSTGHTSHDGDPLDAYQQWIKDHRLALTVAVEGLGSDEPRWDSAMVEAVTVPIGEPDPPPIFTSMNVLKAEYLVARRLAYEGERLLGESPYAQHPTDTGVYADTLDMSLYGEPPAQLILAQRATLDLLDKIAVAANDHFGTGVLPRKVTFANYWSEGEGAQLRAGLPIPEQGASGAVALAELSFDVDVEGLYPEAKTLRNAGTHRLVHLTHHAPSGVTELAHSSIDADALVQAAHQSLRVARAAFIYFIDLVQDQQDAISDGELFTTLPLPNQH